MRINVIPTQFLADQHLLAEYREIKMLPKLLARSSKSKSGINYDNLPKRYTLNKGHGLYFYTRLEYIEQRFIQLLDEMKARGFAINMDSLYDKDYDYSAIDMNIARSNPYVPDLQDYLINSERILLRVGERDGWYKFKGKTMSHKEFVEMYKKNNLIGDMI